MNQRHGRPAVRRSGFTLVELLVVVAVIGVLIGVLTPALGRARETSQSMVGLSNIRQLALGQQAYSSENQGWLAGPLTSGASGIVRNGANYHFSTSGTTPTTTHDWISPTLGAELGFSPNRAQRTWEIFERFRCPRADAEVSLVFGGSGDADISEFTDLHDEQPARQVSYLSPAPFFYSPPAQSAGDQAGSGAPAAWTPNALRRADKKSLVSISTPFRTPHTYRPRMDAIKAPSEKVIIADGTRYPVVVSGFGSRLGLDFDASANPSLYGSFLTSGPIFHKSRAYGRAFAPGYNEFNVDYSIRFFDNTQMHIGFFDGHAERIDKPRAYSDASLWYPSGSKKVGGGGNITPEADEAWDDLTPLP